MVPSGNFVDECSNHILYEMGQQVFFKETTSNNIADRSDPFFY